MENYHEKINHKNTQRLRELQAELPAFVFEFFRGIEPTTSSRTRIAYAYDLKIFFCFLKEHHPACKNKQIIDYPLTLLDQIEVEHLEMYLDYLSYYQTNQTTTHSNNERGKSRKLASLRTFYHYFYKKQKIKKNPAVLIDMPKIHEQHITRLEVDEVAKLLDEVESGDHLSKRQKRFHEHTKQRDLALITLLLGTGIRVSECVGLDIEDIDFETNGLRITRKGGNQAIIYFSDEVADALADYLEERQRILPIAGHEQALFLSLQNKRLTVRSVQNLVKKYAKLITKLKNISPHKLRSTYGTSLYRETGDIYLVADVLGHKDINTTKRHYAQIEDERRRQAAKMVKLREDD